MKKNIVILGLFLICIFPTHAQLIWKVSGNGLKHPSYLFGTHHLIPISFLDSVPDLFRAFNSCEVIVGEMVLNNIDATAMIQQAAIMPNHIKMNDLLSDKEYELVDNELKSVLKIGLKEVSIMNPTLILSLYEMEMFKKLNGITDDVQSDSYFQLVATEKGKKVVGLETADQQISFLFGNGSLERQADILVETIQQKDNALKEMGHLNKLYKLGKIEELVVLAKQRDNISKKIETDYK
ncbi:MAG: TraB/GumN family protein, partial [Paludibacter sp.]